MKNRKQNICKKIKICLDVFFLSINKAFLFQALYNCTKFDISFMIENMEKRPFLGCVSLLASYKTCFFQPLGQKNQDLNKNYTFKQLICCINHFIHFENEYFIIFQQVKKNSTRNFIFCPQGPKYEKLDFDYRLKQFYVVLAMKLDK